MLGWLFPRYHAGTVPGVRGPDRFGVYDNVNHCWLEYRTRRKSAARQRAERLNDQ